MKYYFWKEIQRMYSWLCPSGLSQECILACKIKNNFFISLSICMRGCLYAALISFKETYEICIFSSIWTIISRNMQVWNNIYEKNYRGCTRGCVPCGLSQECILACKTKNNFFISLCICMRGCLYAALISLSRAILHWAQCCSMQLQTHISEFVVIVAQRFWEYKA